RAAWEPDLMDLRSVAKARQYEHFSPAWVPADKSRRTKFAVTPHGLGERGGNLGYALSNKVLVGNDLALLRDGKCAKHEYGEATPGSSHNTSSIDRRSNPGFVWETGCERACMVGPTLRPGQICVDGRIFWVKAPKRKAPEHKLRGSGGDEARYFLAALRRTSPASPARPVPSRVKEAGSGVTEVPPPRTPASELGVMREMI